MFDTQPHFHAIMAIMQLPYIKYVNNGCDNHKGQKGSMKKEEKSWRLVTMLFQSVSPELSCCI